MEGYIKRWDSACVGALDAIARQRLADEVDALGAKSAIAQGLHGPITSIEKLVAAPSTEKLYVFHICVGDGEGSAVGYLKIGHRNLYFYTEKGVVVQRQNTMCVLDFFVESRLQRQGIGIRLFREFIQSTGIEPKDVAYDRPSQKLIAFLLKHCELTRPDLQPNRFVIYPGFLLY